MLPLLRLITKAPVWVFTMWPKLTSVLESLWALREARGARKDPATLVGSVVAIFMIVLSITGWFTQPQLDQISQHLFLFLQGVMATVAAGGVLLTVAASKLSAEKAKVAADEAAKRASADAMVVETLMQKLQISVSPGPVGRVTGPHTGPVGKN